MAIRVEGMPSMFSLFKDEEITWAKKRRTLTLVAENGVQDAQDASFQIQDKGILKKTWRWSFYSDDGVATSAVYSKATHDIYNELGSPSNRKHIGFYSRAVDENTDKYYELMEEGVLDDRK